MTPTSFKTLHSFTVSLDKEVTETTTREENGQKITVESKVTKSVPHTVVLKEPSRRERQELALFQQVSYNEAITKGLLPKIVMQQKLAKEANSPLSETEDKNIALMNARLEELSAAYTKLNTTPDPISDELRASKEKVLVEYLALYKKVEDLNTAYQSVYAYTAENYMQTKTLTWLTLFLTYTRTAPDAAPAPMFPGTDYATKEDRAGDLEDAGDPLFKASLEKLSTYWHLYLFNRANKPEDFARIEVEWAKRQAEQAKMKEEAEKAAAQIKAAAEAPVAPAPTLAEPVMVSEGAASMS